MVVIAVASPYLVYAVIIRPYMSNMLIASYIYTIPLMSRRIFLQNPCEMLSASVVAMIPLEGLNPPPYCSIRVV